jgi:hypothetical protein
MGCFEITSIGKNNREAFRSYIPAGIFRQLKSGSGPLALGVLSEGWGVGALTFELRETRAQILSLCIDPTHYTESCAANLLQSLVEIILEDKNIRSIEGLFVPKDTKESWAMTMAYGMAGFTLGETAVKSYTVSLGNLLKAHGQKNERTDDRVVLLSDLPENRLSLLNRFLRANPMAYIDLPVREGDLIPEISVISLDAEGEPDGALLCNNRTDTGFSLALLVFRDKAAARKGMPMLRLAMGAAGKLFAPETNVQICGVNDFGNALIGKLTKGAILRQMPMIRAVWQPDASPKSPSAADLIFHSLEEMWHNEGGLPYA